MSRLFFRMFYSDHNDAYFEGNKKKAVIKAIFAGAISVLLLGYDFYNFIFGIHSAQSIAIAIVLTIAALVLFFNAICAIIRCNRILKNEEERVEMHYENESRVDSGVLANDSPVRRPVNCPNCHNNVKPTKKMTCPKCGKYIG